MVQLYTAEISRQCDQALVAGGLSGFELMQRAALAVFNRVKAFQDQQNKPWPIKVIAGKGNNGADAYLVAYYAINAGFDVECFALTTAENMQSDRAKALQFARKKLKKVNSLSTYSNAAPAILIDGLLGTGLNKPLDAKITSLVNTINQGQDYIIAIDAPSGLCADTGTVLGAAIKANETVSFITHKRGLFTAAGPDHVGDYYFDALIQHQEQDLWSAVSASLPKGVELIDLATLKAALPKRAYDSHKGQFGHSVLIGGNEGMAGAIILSAEAALSVGAGLVTVVTRPNHVTAINSRTPELMTATDTAAITQALSQADVIAIGPGLGQDDWAKALWQKAWQSSKPLVIDASALYFLSILKQSSRPYPIVITPHPGEAGQLLQCDAKQIQADRFKSVELMAKRYNAIVVLKGLGSLIATQQLQALCSAGNPGMATAGMGDVLTGLITGLVAQGLVPTLSTQLAVALHAVAGDNLAKQQGFIGIKASDIKAAVRVLINE